MDENFGMLVGKLDLFRNNTQLHILHVQLIRKEIYVDEHERLSNISLTHKFK